MKKITSFFLLFCLSKTFAQIPINQNLKISGYLETYYGYDFGRPKNLIRPSFIYNHNRHNEVNLNLGFVKIAYEDTKTRANLALMAGTYANANLAAENGVLKNIYEANIGLKLSKTSETWLDAGIFSSHIGFESAVGKDCWTLTRSILAENSPYYESGLKISHQSKNQKWFLSGLILNGWQQINRINNDQSLSFGSQILFKPNEKITLNSSSFLNNQRFFHNFYGIFQSNPKFGLIAGFDIGRDKRNNDVLIWYSPVLIGKFELTEKWKLALRFENYTDKKGAIIFEDFSTNGYSLNLDFLPTERIYWRIEGKIFKSKKQIYLDKESMPTNLNGLFSTSLCFSI